MALASGTRFGPYEILAQIGAGGMGEVYRARDTRLNRDVAIKVLPPSVADDADRLNRFEQEARAVGRLSHPNILTLHDFGRSEGVSYAVTELLEGETLRARLAVGALPPRKVADIGAQTARGLAAAHDKHIVHRDLKPENIFITSDGQVKILDFGLARRTDTHSERDARSDSPTVSVGTEPGVVLGTIGYMAPEQVRGEQADHRADIFALGVVLYEMLCGRQPFAADTAPETMTAILKQDPPDPAGFGITAPPALLRIVRRALEKRPEERFQSTRDLAFALESSVDSSSPSGPAPMAHVNPSAAWLRTMGLLVAGGLLGAAAFAGLARARQASPSVSMAALTFRQLTFERGTVKDARFTPDGQSVIYSAAWEGQPLRIFMTRTDAHESVKLQLPDARLLSISQSGEMAISLGHVYEGWMGAGTLARSSLLGAAPRILAEHVREAEWAPDGNSLAIVRRVEALEQLEFPLGRPLHKTAGYISDIRFSPDGKRIAFTDHPVFADDAGGVSIVTLDGQRTQLATGFNSVRGLAWSRDGREIWFTGRSGEARGVYALHAVTLNGQLRTVYSNPSRLRLHDLAADGRVLLSNDIHDRRVDALFAGAPTPVDVSLRTESSSHWISDDGMSITITDQETSEYTTYLIQAGSPAVRLGEGQAFGESPDRRWVIGLPISGSPVMIHPTAAGETRTLPNPDRILFDIAGWLPDSRRIVAFGHKEGGRTRGYVQDIEGGAPRSLTAEGVTAARWWLLPVSPDGSRIIALDATGMPTIYAIADGSAEPVRGLNAGEMCLRWTADGRALFVARGGGLPWVVERLELATGRRTPVREIRAREGAGLRLSVIGITPDGKGYVHSYSRLLSDLFVVDGLH